MHTTPAVKPRAKKSKSAGSHEDEDTSTLATPRHDKALDLLEPVATSLEGNSPERDAYYRLKKEQTKQQGAFALASNFRAEAKKARGRKRSKEYNKIAEDLVTKYMKSGLEDYMGKDYAQAKSGQLKSDDRSPSDEESSASSD